MKTVKFNGVSIAPSKIICIGRNYVEHIAELGNEIPDDMVVFNKPNSAISSCLQSFHQEPLHYEGELCFLVQGGEFVGVGFGLDLTKRELQSKLKSKGLPWERAKAFNGAAVFSDFVEIKASDIDGLLSVELTINGGLTQQGGVELMMYKPSEILKELKTYTELNDGDIVMTGTPKGVGVIKPSDEFWGRICLNGVTLTQQTWLAT